MRVSPLATASCVPLVPTRRATRAAAASPARRRTSKRRTQGDRSAERSLVSRFPAAAGMHPAKIDVVRRDLREVAYPAVKRKRCENPGCRCPADDRCPPAYPGRPSACAHLAVEAVEVVEGVELAVSSMLRREVGDVDRHVRRRRMWRSPLPIEAAQLLLRSRGSRCAEELVGEPERLIDPHAAVAEGAPLGAEQVPASACRADRPSAGSGR